MKSVLLLGGIIIDHYYVIDKYPQQGQDTTIHKSFAKIGGCALNVGVTLGNLGGKPYVVSMLGQDAAGKQIEKYLGGLQLPTDYLQFVESGTTGYCLNMVDADDERTFFTYQGCQGDFPSDLSASELAASVDCVYVTGYFLGREETCRQTLAFLEQWRGLGHRKPVIFDPGPLVNKVAREYLLRMLQLSDWLLPNIHELTIIASMFDVRQDPVLWLRDHGCDKVVVKQGASGATAYTPDAVIKADSFAVKVKDTTGAGDSFIGGFIYGLLQGAPLDKALEWATACGAYTTTIEGPHAMFTKQDITQFIESYKDRK